jgi:hypothetical protein
VKIGITDGNFTEVQQGDLQEGQQVVVGISVPGTKPAAAPASPMPRRI